MNEIQKLAEKREELKREVEKLDTQIKELEEQEKKCKRWRANQDERYWYIGRSGAVCYLVEINDHLDKSSYEIGNYFKTEEETKKVVEKIKIYTQLKDLALRLNKGEMIRWNDFKQSKYCIMRDIEYDELSDGPMYCYQDIGQIYCLDKNFLEIAKQEIGEENLRKLFE